jgi:hypothetical protein
MTTDIKERDRIITVCKLILFSPVLALIAITFFAMYASK